VDALSNSGGTEKALGSVKTLLALAPDDPAAITRAARVNLDAGKAKEAVDLYDDLVTRFGDKLAPDEKGDVMLRFGEAMLKAGDPDGAVRRHQKFVAHVAFTVDPRQLPGGPSFLLC